MYVCFGFSLARSRRTRTIDLQCQSLFLREAVLLRSVCLSLHRTVQSYAVRWPSHSQNQTKNHGENRSEIDPRRHLGTSKIDSKSFRDPLGTHHGFQERPEGVSGRSLERSGASPARCGSVRRVPDGAPARQKGRPGASGSAPRRPKSTPSRIRMRKNRVFLAQRVREASSE